MSEDQFDKLFRYMQTEFGKIREEFDEMHQQFDRIYGLIDTVMKDHETEQHERLAMCGQLGRHEEWVQRAARQLSIKYSS